MIMQLQNTEAICYCAHVRPCKAGEIALIFQRRSWTSKTCRSWLSVEQDSQPGGDRLSMEALPLCSRDVVLYPVIYQNHEFAQVENVDEILVLISMPQNHAHPEEAEVKSHEHRL